MIILKKNFLKFLTVFMICLIMITPIVAQAATKDFKFDMTHQLYIGKYKSTKNSVTGKINMTSWGGDTYFTIHVYEKKNWWSNAELVTRLGFEKSSKGSPYTDTDYSVKKGHTYSYEIWKNYNYKRIIGKGSLSY